MSRWRLWNYFSILTIFSDFLERFFSDNVCFISQRITKSVKSACIQSSFDHWNWLRKQNNSYPIEFFLGVPNIFIIVLIHEIDIRMQFIPRSRQNLATRHHCLRLRIEDHFNKYHMNHIFASVEISALHVQTNARLTHNWSSTSHLDA